MAILKCEGYQMFRGIAVVTPRNPNVEPFKIFGDWLYRPDTHCWYINGSSFCEEIVSNIQDFDVVDVKKPPVNLQLHKRDTEGNTL